MGGLLKLLAVVIGAVVVLVVAAVLVVVAVFDPNDYRDDIARAVADSTGRTLMLEGDLELRVFPRLEIALGRAQLGNAPGFGEQPFAQIDGAQLQLEILPLLSRRIEIGEARLDGLTLNLARDANGMTNWEDLAGTDPADAAPPPEEPAAEDDAFDLAGLDIAALSITDANVNWNDAATDTSWSLEDFGLEASELGSGRAFPLALEFGFTGEAITVEVAANTQATLDLVQNAYRLDDLEVYIAGAGEAWPGGEGEAALTFDALAANLAEESVDLDNLTLTMLGISASGDLTGRQLMSDLSLSGEVDIAPFNPRDVLQALDLTIDTADAGVLRQANARADLVYDSSQLMLQDMRLALDDSQLTGSLGMVDDALRFSLDLDEINIDRYLPPADETEGEAEEGSLDEVDLPVDVFRTLTASGDFDLARAQFSGLQLTDARFTFEAEDGRVRLVPTASAYGGTIEGQVRIDVEGDEARFGLVQNLQNIDLLGFGRDYLDMEDLSGTGAITLDVTATGRNLGQLQRDLDGDVSFAFTDGAWEGFDVWYELRRARAVLEGESAPEREGPRRTPFSEIAASGVVEDALLTNRDLRATFPFMIAEGSGTVNLLNDELDLELTARFVEGPAFEDAPEMEGLIGDELPLDVGGTIDEPSIRPDFAALVRARAGEAVQERLDEERSELDEEVEQERSEAEQRVEEERSEIEERIEEEREEVRERLRGLFD